MRMGWASVAMLAMVVMVVMGFCQTWVAAVAEGAPWQMIGAAAMHGVPLPRAAR